MRKFENLTLLDFIKEKDNTVIITDKRDKAQWLANELPIEMQKLKLHPTVEHTIWNWQTGWTIEGHPYLRVRVICFHSTKSLYYRINNIMILE